MAAVDTERNLLFALLAMQNNFIDREALLAAFSVWMADRSRPIGQVLVERHSLTPDELHLLEALVSRHIQKFGDDTRKSLGSLSSIGSVRDELTRIADADLYATLQHVATTNHVDLGRAANVSSLGSSTSDGSRFRILRPHARGGLGQVSVALDRELDRPVAFKEIQETQADNPLMRARFIQEAEITGKLEHPGIIPVYGLGHDITGRPFYAMRFIHGDSLKEAITAFHGDERLRKDPADRDARLRELLRRFTDVCNAIAYAHSRGVLHRDLKPGNIMLGPYGETLVVDWGLAKAQGEVSPSSQDQADAPPPMEGPIRLSGSREAWADTVAGSVLGTPAYASPEQLSGQLEQLGPASDVYGLGATLYALLTGRDPVELREVRELLARQATDDLERTAPAGGDERQILAEVLRRVRMGEIPPPRSIDSAIPGPLEAICLKAMALKPEDRYPSARALAEDVTRWLDDAPVSAYPESLAARAGRWIRRHQRVVSSMAAAVLVGLVALGMAYVHESGINHELRVARVKDQIGTVLERFHGTDVDVEFVAGKIRELERLAPAEVAPQRASLGRKLVEAVNQRIHQERPLSPSDVDRIRAEIARLKDYDPESAPNLETALAERLARLDTVFALAPPYDGLASVFEPGRIRASGQGVILAENGPPGGGRTIPTRVPCQGDVEFEGTFALPPGAVAGERFGLALNVRGDQGYFFTLSSDQPLGSGRVASNAVAAPNSPRRLTMTLERGKVVLRRTELDLPGSTVNLFAQKKGDRLSFAIGATALSFDDIFSTASVGTFGVVLSGGVRLDRLAARKHRLPVSPSLLEQGDAFYTQATVAQGALDRQTMFARALEEFDRVEKMNQQSDLKSEVEYKKALCLLELRRAVEARTIFEKLATIEGRWQTRAACQVWKILLKSQGRTNTEQADLVFDRLNASVDYAELALVLSEEERDQILSYYRQVDHYPRINYSELRGRNLERVLKIEDLIKADPVTRRRTLWRYADACRLNGRDREAVEVIEKLLASPDLLPDDRIGITRDYAMMMIVGRTPARAREEIDRRMGRDAPDPQDALFPMLLDRARVHAALGDWKQAEEDVARFIERVRKPATCYSDFAEACLFHGFLLERQGRTDDARKAWRAGLRSNWPRDLPVIVRSDRPIDGKALRDNMKSLLHFVMLASLTGELKAEETGNIVTETRGSGEFTNSPIVRFFDSYRTHELLAPEHIRAICLETYRAPMGRELARKEAFLEITLTELFNRPLLLSLEAEIRLDAIPEGGEPELARLIDEGLGEIARMQREGRFTLPQLMMMLTAWTGNTSFLGWAGLENSLAGQKPLRGRIAYVYGRRFLVLKNLDVARHLFQLTRQDTPPDSPFQKLAQDQLDKLGAK